MSHMTDVKAIFISDVVAAGAAATGKIKCFGHTPTSSTATVVALEELDSADTAVNSMTIRIRIIGY